MNPDQPELTFEESVAQVMKTLPPVIRAYLAQGKYTPVAKALMAKYGLRIDQGGVLEREIMLLLMGIENPDEFTKALIEEAHLDQQITNNIVQDVNAQIFIPLRAEEMKSATTIPEPPKPRAPMPSPVIPQTQSYAPPLQSPRYANTPSVPPGAENPPAYTRPAQTPSNTEYPPVSTIVTSRPTDRTLMLEDHEEPHIEFDTTPVSPPAPRTAPPPPNLPGALPPLVQERAVPPPTQTKHYSSDPYREPIG